MIQLEQRNIRSLLCLGAHADDIEIGCGGAILRLLAENPHCSVHWVLFSANQERRQEAEAGARQFLAQAENRQIVIHDFQDSFFPYQAEKIKNVFHEMSRELEPDVIFTHRRDDAHQDHRTLAELTWCAFRNHLILEYEIPKYEGDLGHPNFFVTLDKPTCQRKIQSLLNVYQTQSAKSWFSEDTFWSLLRIRGVECNATDGYAEGFHCRKFVC